MKNIINISLLISILVSCSGGNDEADAWGNFESREIMISSENNGKILSMPVNEGDVLNKNKLIAIVDTTLIKLQLSELEAGHSSILTRLASVDAQNRIIDQQIINLKANIERVENMLRDQAATQKQLDDLRGQLEVLEKQKRRQ
ncbi:MAG: hypothetical protein U5K32_06860 [Bacteroidales bacterium]|nr:hypothetical protein [Bacteroidales bacterium]